MGYGGHMNEGSGAAESKREVKLKESKDARTRWNIFTFGLGSTLNTILPNPLSSFNKQQPTATTAIMPAHRFNESSYIYAMMHLVATTSCYLTCHHVTISGRCDYLSSHRSPHIRSTECWLISAGDDVLGL